MNYDGFSRFLMVMIKNMMRFLSSLTLLFLLSPSVLAETYYMRADGIALQMQASGSKGGNCTSASTAMNIDTHNAGSFIPDDIINICDNGGIYYLDIPGSYFTPPSSGSASGGYITYQAASGATPVFDGSCDAKGSTADWNSAGPYWYTISAHGAGKLGQITTVWVKKGESSGPGLYKSISSLTKPGDWSQSGSFIYFYIFTGGSDATSNPATYFDSIRRNLNDYILYIYSKSYLIFSGLTFQRHAITGEVGRPVNLPVIPSKGTVFISGSDHIQVLNNNFSDVEGAVFTINSTNLFINNNTLSGLYNDTTNAASNDAYGFHIGSSSTTVTNNSINPRYILYDGTTVARNGQGIRCVINDNANSSLSNLNIGYNKVSNVIGYGVILTGDYEPSGGLNVNAIVENNTLTNGNPASGIDDDGLAAGDKCSFRSGNYYSGLSFRYNRVDGYGNSCGQATCSWKGVEWQYNIMSNCGGTRGWGGISAGRDHKVLNNTIYNTSGYGIYIGNGVPNTMEIKNNIIHTVLSQGSNGFGIGGNNLLGNIVYNNCIYNVANSPVQSPIKEINTINNDPKFVNIGTDYTLQFFSPCINTGTDVSLIQDYAGNKVPIGPSPDIGALEFQEYLPPPPRNIQIR